MTASLGWTCPCGRHNAYRDVCLCGASAIDLLHPASQNAASPEEAELQRRAEPSGMPHEETVAGEMAAERADARLAEAEGGGWWTALARISRKET